MSYFVLPPRSLLISVISLLLPRTWYYHQAHKLRVLAITHPDKHRAIVKKRSAAKLRVIEARKTAAHKKAAGLGEPPSNDLMKVRNRFQMNTVGLDKVRFATQSRLYNLLQVVFSVWRDSHLH
jgi:hypothetical protein